MIINLVQFFFENFCEYTKMLYLRNILDKYFNSTRLLKSNTTGIMRLEPYSRFYHIYLAFQHMHATCLALFMYAWDFGNLSIP